MSATIAFVERHELWSPMIVGCDRCEADDLTRWFDLSDGHGWLAQVCVSCRADEVATVQTFRPDLAPAVCEVAA